MAFPYSIYAINTKDKRRMNERTLLLLKLIINLTKLNACYRTEPGITNITQNTGVDRLADHGEAVWNRAVISAYPDMNKIAPGKLRQQKRKKFAAGFAYA